MIYCSIDIETTGLDPDKHQILEIGAILYESGVGELDRYHTFVKHDNYVGSAFALHMNREILNKLAHYKDYPEYTFIREAEIRTDFGSWIHGVTEKYGTVVPAGKNFASFDRQFLLRVFPGIGKYIHHRTLDPGAMFVVREDEKIPALDHILERCGMNSHVSHNALDDAQQVIDVLEWAFDRLGLAKGKDLLDAWTPITD